MRTAAVGAGALASLVAAVLVMAAGPSVGFAQRTPTAPVLGGEGLIALPAQSGDQRQQITVIDPATRVMGVYHIDLATGEVTLKSVRRIHWDLQMNEFNATHPLPGEIRSMVEQ
jgi:anti-sigma-K factor RskA